MFLALQIVVCVVLVFIVGRQLSRSADVLAEKSGLGRTWVGAILLAGATSLPELTTGVSAIVVLNEPDLAAGGVFGSCLFNLLILVLLDSLSGPAPLFKQIHISHGLSASLGCILLGTAAGGILVVDPAVNVVVGWIGIPTILLFVIYALSTRMIARFEQQRQSEYAAQFVEELQYRHIGRAQTYIRFVALTVAIVVLGAWLAWLGDRVAEVTGLGESFIGALLLAAATSLPEVVASLEAIRIRAIDLAVSNIFGSNIFNLAILAVYDLVYLHDSIWLDMNPIYAFTATTAITMTAIAIVGLIYREGGRLWLRLSWNSLALVALYLVGMYVLYRG